ncbi:MAG: hypothetical protein GY801_30645 [bacterium]|nr:hypothetical protein [bacterium]
MKVVCAVNNIYELGDENTIARLKKYIRLSDGQLNIQVNSIYVVYGILFLDNSPWYYLCPFEDDEDPTPFPAELFNIVDDTIPSCWKLSYQNNRGTLKTELVFPEWSRDPLFYEQLVDGDPEKIRLFKKYRQLLEQ